MNPARPTTIRTVARVAVPSALGMLASYAMQIVDTLFIGQLGPLALGGAALGNAICAIFFVVGLGFLSSLDFLMAHAHGARNRDDGRRWFTNGLFLALVLGLISVALIQLIATEGAASGGFYARFGVAPDLAQQAITYLKPMSWTLIPFFIFQVQRVYLQSRSVVVPAMIILILANFMNALGNWLFVLGRPIGWEAYTLTFTPMGIAGSGYATGVSRIFMMVALAGYLAYYRHRHDLHLSFSEWIHITRPQRVRLKRMVRLGAPAAFQMLFEVGVFSTATLFAGKLGENALAAHQIALQIASTTFMLPLGISAAAASLVGQSMGQRDRVSARELGWSSFRLGSIVMAICAGAILAFGSTIVQAFTQHPVVLSIAIPLLAIVACFQLFDGAQAVMTGALRGAGNTMASAMANLIGHWVIGLPLGLLLAYRANWGVFGIWIGLSTGLIVVAIYLTLFWKRWMRDAI